MRKKPLWIGIGVVIAFALLGDFGFYTRQNPADVPEYIKQDSVETAAADFEYEIGDPSFKKYVVTVLWSQCPFYQPSGALYRECLWRARDEAKGAYRGKDEEKIQADCAAIGSRFYGLIGGEATLACEAYRYSRDL